MIGRVVSVKLQKTATVLVDSTKTHPLYKKRFKSSKKYLVDDSFGVSLGDVVEFIKVAPISKRKHWRITKVIGKDLISLGEEHLKTKAKEAIAEILPEEEKKTPTDSVDLHRKKGDK